ncbi:MAG: NAD(P)/FAD-dependent oxidoreductase [Chitinophagales bacterium]
MQKTIQLKLLASEAASESVIRTQCGKTLGCSSDQISGFHILKKSLDARAREHWILLTLLVFLNEPLFPRKIFNIQLKDCSRSSKKVIVVGAGPAGLFAALKLAESGIQPILIERGKEVRTRRRDLAKLNKEGIINPESNYCFGEGGAGTYSDGKLYTRSTKRGDVNRILNILVQFGAEENILYEAHPHIGTNKLPHIITSVREALVSSGAIFRFEKKLVDWVIEKDNIQSVSCADGEEFSADALILATGHSARDIFLMLNRKRIRIEPKSFALGVRIEHPQELIDGIQYKYLNSAPGKSAVRPDFLPPASYSLVHKADDGSVFSFCMCPGGIIAPAATADGQVVVNGWSPSKRNNPFANSGIVVTVNEKSLFSFSNAGPLSGMFFQQMIEEKAFRAGGGKFVAPAQRMTDFAEGNISSSLPDCSYLPGIHSASLDEVLPEFISIGLRRAFLAFGKKMKGYYTSDAVILATESRTSSPVRIPRDPLNLHHPEIRNLFPCGEGAGYAGGIMSAAMDGERVAGRLIELLT